jgi:hypothetical protein
MMDSAYEHMVKQMIREQQERDRQMQHQGWFRRSAAVPAVERYRMAIGGLLISLGTRLQHPTPGPLSAQGEGETRPHLS